MRVGFAATHTTKGVLYSHPPKVFRQGASPKAVRSCTARVSLKKWLRHFFRETRSGDATPYEAFGGRLLPLSGLERGLIKNGLLRGRSGIVSAVAESSSKGLFTAVVRFVGCCRKRCCCHHPGRCCWCHHGLHRRRHPSRFRRRQSHICQRL